MKIMESSQKGQKMLWEKKKWLIMSISPIPWNIQKICTAVNTGTQQFPFSHRIFNHFRQNLYLGALGATSALFWMNFAREFNLSNMTYLI